MAVDEGGRTYEHPLYDMMLKVPGLSVATTSVDRLLTWGLENALWVFPMATSCCGIELMATAASRVDIDRMGTIVRGSPRQADVMVVAGTITVKMAPRVKRLWDMMPEPKWCIAMGSCAISGDFYRDLYSVIPGIDTVIPVDVYVPGCPPNPEGLMHGMMRLQEKVRAVREGKFSPPEKRPAILELTRRAVKPIGDPERDPRTDAAQLTSAMRIESAPEDEKPFAPEEAPAPEASAPASDAAPADFEALLRERFGVAELPKGAPPIVDATHHVALARALRAGGYRQLVHVVASHWPEAKDKAGQVTDAEHYEIAYAVRTVGRPSKRATWRLRVEHGAAAPTLFGTYAGADWLEREQYDLVGVKFAGHPDLRRLLLPESWQGHPLRKDYPSDMPCPPWR